MAAFPSQEGRPLSKRYKISGVPEIYPQDPKQKEDELSDKILKSGFSFAPVHQNDEYETAKNVLCSLAPDKFAKFLNETITKKLDLNILPDTNKRKQQACSKENSIQVTAKTKPFVDAWLKDLASTKPLSQLAKKVPIFNKREEIIEKLCALDVSLPRATWFVKMTNAYNMATAQEVRNNKKKAFDPCIEWTQVIVRFLSELFGKIVEHYRSSAPNSTFTTNSSIIDIDTTMQQWNYCHMLTRYMYEEGLLENNDFLQWLLEILEKCWSADDMVLKIVISQLTKYINEFIQSFVMSRRLAHFCCKKLAQLCYEPLCVTSSSTWLSSASFSSTGVTSPSSAVTCNSGPPSSSASSLSPMMSQVSQSAQPLFIKCTTCALHRDIILMLTAFLHTVLINCPSACVWFNLRSDGPSEVLCGSALDLLPCSTTQLPISAGDDEPMIRSQLRDIEMQIINRSRASEAKWSRDRSLQSRRGEIVTRLYNILLALDRHHFDRVESNSSLDTLYSKIFGSNDMKDMKAIPHEIILPLLCDWAISSKRHGRHRALVLGVLLEKRQAELIAKKGEALKQQEDEKEANTQGDELSLQSSVAPFHDLLFDFIDSRSSSISDNKSMAENRLTFTNLVTLFAELIRREVFSHDAYMCTLISRGELSQGSIGPQTVDMDVSSVKSERLEKGPDDSRMDVDNSDYEPFSHKDDVRSAASVPEFLPGASILPPPGQAQTPKGVPTPGSIARTPGAPPTPGIAKTPGAPPTPGHAYTPGAAPTPGSVLTPLDHSGGMLPPTNYLTSSGNSTMHSAAPGASATNFTPQGSVLSAPESRSRSPSKHIAFVTHIPIPQDDWRVHECNQRLILLYGVGRARDAARRVVKKVLKDVQRLFSKKNCIDVASGDVVAAKKKKQKDRISAVVGLEDFSSLSASFEVTTNKFQRLSFYDQHAVTSVCLSSVLELFTTFTTGGENCQYLPLVENIAYLMELMESCLNISGLLDFVVQILVELPAVQQAISKLSIGRTGSSTPSSSNGDNGNSSRVNGLLNIYVSSLSLHLLGILRKFHTCLLISQQQTISVFESLCKLVKHVTNPSDCTSSERCILAYLYDLYNCCAFLKAKFAELFGSASARVKSALFASLSPNTASLHLDQNYMQELFDNVNARTRPDIAVVRLLNESAQDRYSFVCNVILRIFSSNNANVDRLCDLATLCAEYTARCNALSADWLGVLKALCCSSNQKCGYYDLLTFVNVGDRMAYDSVAVFTMILVCRHCFQLEDFIANVGMPSLLALYGSSLGDMDAEPGALLTCHILLRLLVTSSSSSSSSSSSLSLSDLTSELALRRGMPVKTCEKNLLHAAHFSVKVGAMMAVLKAILMLSETCSIETTIKTSPDKANTSTSRSGLEYTSLGEYARHVLREICSEEWVRVKFLDDLENLFTPEVLLDKSLQPKQMQRLVQMICYPERASTDMSQTDVDDEDEEDKNKNHVMTILQSLDLWTMRVSWLELHLMFKQASPIQTTVLLGNIASCILQIFQQCTELKSDATAELLLTPSQCKQVTTAITEADRDVVWLISSLVGHLPKEVKGCVVKSVGQVLDEGSNAWCATVREEKEKLLLKSILLLGYQPFLNLVLACLKDLSEQEELLLLLSEHLDKFLAAMKELNDKGSQADEKIKLLMLEVLQLRLSLVGNMMETMKSDSSFVQTWATQYIQLIMSGIVDINDNSDLFLMVYDMLSYVVLSTLISESGEREDGKKTYQQLMRKLKKEIGERQSESLSMLRQLLPVPRKMIEVITNEIYCDNKVKDKRKNLQIGGKQKINPWDVIEGQKHPTPLSWSWFCAIKLERKRLRYDQQHKLLQNHTHPLLPAPSYYLETPEYPPEDIETPLAPPKEEIIVNEPAVIEVKPTESKSKKKAKRKQSTSRQNSQTAGIHPYISPNMDAMHSMPSPMYTNMPQPWNSFPSGINQAPPTVQQPPQYFQQQPVSAGRFVSPLPTPADRRALLANNIRLRAQQQQPQQFLMPSQSQPGMMMPRGPQNSMVRERLKNLTGGQQQQQPQAGFQQMPQQGGFTSYQSLHMGQTMPVETQGPQMVSSQNFGGPAANQMSSIPGQQAGSTGTYMAQHPQYSNVNRFNSAVGGSGGPTVIGGMGAMQQASSTLQQGMGASGNYGVPQGTANYNPQQQQLDLQRRQQQQQQQLAALQQQQMQRQMSGQSQSSFPPGYSF